MGGFGAPHQCSLRTAACCLLIMLTRATLMTSSHSEGPCGGTASNEVWMFGNESEAAIVKVMAIREQLRPYVRSNGLYALCAVWTLCYVLRQMDGFSTVVLYSCNAHASMFILSCTTT